MPLALGLKGTSTHNGWVVYTSQTEWLSIGGIPTKQRTTTPLPACYLALLHTNNHSIFFLIKKIFSILVNFFFIYFNYLYQSYTFPRLAHWIKKFKELIG